MSGWQTFVEQLSTEKIGQVIRSLAGPPGKRRRVVFVTDIVRRLLEGQSFATAKERAEAASALTLAVGRGVARLEELRYVETPTP